MSEHWNRICYHGTTAKAARKILSSGFWPYTWFASHLEDALGYGGPYVFDVAFEGEPPDWQFGVPEAIGPERIVRYRVIRARIVTVNPLLGAAIFRNTLLRTAEE